MMASSMGIRNLRERQSVRKVRYGIATEQWRITGFEQTGEAGGTPVFEVIITGWEGPEARRDGDGKSS